MESTEVKQNRYVATANYDGSRIKDLLRHQGRTVRWFGELTEYHETDVSRFLNGTRPVPDLFANRAASILGIPVDWLLVEEPEPANV